MGQFSQSLSSSLELLAVLSAQGLVIVPSEPTPEMLEAGKRASGLSSEEVKRLYQVLITHADEEVSLLKS